MTVTARVKSGTIAGTFDEDGRRYTVTLTYTDQPAQAADDPTALTVAHEPIPDGARDVSISGTVRVADWLGESEISGGQVREDAAKVPGWERVAALWERWHLNGLRAACVHQAADAAAIYRARPDYAQDAQRWAELRALRCPDGYAYGSAWLFEPVPADVLAELRSIFGVE